MHIEIAHSPGYSAAKVDLTPGEVCTTEGGCMIAMSADLQVKTTTQKRDSGGLLKGAKRLLAGESFFLNHYTAGANGGHLWLAATLPGDMMQYELREEEKLIVQAGSFVACEEGVDIDLGWQGFKSLFSGERAFWLHMKGPGKVVLSSFGAIYPVDVSGEYIVDSGHIVAFNESLEFDITKAGRSWISSFLGGEGLVCRFHGEGAVWCQSHNPPSFGRLLGPLLPPRGA